jgi:hypothetical protein
MTKKTPKTPSILEGEIRDLESKLAEAYGQRDALKAELADLQAKCEAALAWVAAGPDWREVNLPFSHLAVAAVDIQRLAGLEVEVAGKRYLIGDINPDAGQFGQTNQAFRRDAVVTRARQLVKR